jgi:transposase
MDVIFCVIDWGERHHDVALVDEQGMTLATCRIADDAAGLTEVLGLLAKYTDAAREGAQFVVVDMALENDHGLLVMGLRAAGHRVFSINSKAVDRYRDRYAPSGAKSDAANALVLAHLLRTDRDRHRPMPEDSEQVTALAVLARTHQDCVRVAVRDAARLRSLLREFFPAALVALPNLNTRTAVTV